MRMSRMARLLLVCSCGVLLTGGLATLYVAWRPGTFAPGALSRELLIAGASALVLTLANLFLRFVRWQFVLRRLDLRVPTVESLAAFVGSFALLPVPLLLGQLWARRRLLPSPDDVPVATIVLAFAWARWLDVWALLALGAWVMPRPWNGVAFACVALAGIPRVRRAGLSATLSILAAAWNLLSPHALTFETQQVRDVLAARRIAVGAAISLVAWAMATSAFGAVALAAGTGGHPLWLSSAAAASILGGGLSLMPMGVATSGIILLDFLREAGAPTASALEAVFVYRFATVGFSVALGGVVLLATRRPSLEPAPGDHFDAIDVCYDAWLPMHYRDHLVASKVGRMDEHLVSLGDAPRGLDIGCGRGWYMGAIRASGASVVGMDLSRRQIVAAREHVGAGTPLCQGSLVELPFRSARFDFAYTINVVHHLPSRGHQREALREVARVLRPGGLFFLHDMNIRNPLFRLYVSYLFPLLKGIDEGTEHFLDPRQLPLPETFELIAVDYFSFVPDFCPEPLLPAMRAIERRLVASSLAPMGAHFLAVLRRCGAP